VRAGSVDNLEKLTPRLGLVVSTVGRGHLVVAFTSPLRPVSSFLIVTGFIAAHDHSSVSAAALVRLACLLRQLPLPLFLTTLRALWPGFFPIHGRGNRTGSRRVVLATLDDGGAVLTCFWPPVRLHWMFRCRFPSTNSQ